MKLTEDQWAFIKPMLPKEKVRKDKRGRPWREPRDVLEGSLWILKTGARWKDLPERYPPYQTCHRRYQNWVKSGVFKKILLRLAQHLQEKGKINLAETFIDATFVDAKKRGPQVGKTKRGKGTKIMAVVADSSLPIAVSIASASPAEITLVESTIRQRHCKNLPERIIGDKAYDSDPHDEHLRRRFGIERIAPHKRNRTRKPTQDGRALRRYKRRWQVERFFSWLQSFRRIKTRYEYNDHNYLGMVQLASITIMLRYL